MYKIMIKKFKIISSKEFNSFIKVIKNTFYNLDKKIIKILKYGLWFCLLITLIGVSILLINLFILHSQMIYEIGIKLFQISLYYIVFFIASAITVDYLHRNLY